MEYLQVFDKNRNVLNEKVDRKNKYNLPLDKYFMIVLIFIENDEGCFLMQKTSKSKHSCIAVTGGHVTFGDTGIETVVKEVKEELGMDLLPNNINFVDATIYKNCHLEIYYTKNNVDIESLVLQESEVEYVKWYSIDEIYEFIRNNEFREANIEPFNRILEYINK